jgi:hypothetical protein
MNEDTCRPDFHLLVDADTFRQFTESISAIDRELTPNGMGKVVP